MLYFTIFAVITAMNLELLLFSHKNCKIIIPKIFSVCLIKIAFINFKSTYKVIIIFFQVILDVTFARKFFTVFCILSLIKISLHFYGQSLSSLRYAVLSCLNIFFSSIFYRIKMHFFVRLLD